MSFRYAGYNRLAQAVTQCKKHSPISPGIARWQIRYPFSISNRCKTQSANAGSIAKEATKVSETKPISDSTSALQKINNFMLESRPVIGSFSALSNNVAFGCGAMWVEEQRAQIEDTVYVIDTIHSFVCQTYLFLIFPIIRAFLCSDICTLRYMAVTSQTFMITSNLFVRPHPLWPKLRWNVLLLGINLVMLTNLLLERERANHLPEELEELYYTGQFEKRGKNCTTPFITSLLLFRRAFIL